MFERGEEGGGWRIQISDSVFFWKVCVNDSSVMLKSKETDSKTNLNSDPFGLYFAFSLHYEKVEIGMMKYLFRPLEKYINYKQGGFLTDSAIKVPIMELVPSY